MRLLGLIGVAALLASGAQERPKPKVHTITIADMRFTPESLTVARGDVVVWVNKDLVAHTATSPDDVFDSKTIESNGSWRYVARRAGSFPYVCSLHPAMKGTFRVK